MNLTQMFILFALGAGIVIVTASLDSYDGPIQNQKNSGMSSSDASGARAGDVSFHGITEEKILNSGAISSSSNASGSGFRAGDVSLHGAAKEEIPNLDLDSGAISFSKASRIRTSDVSLCGTTEEEVPNSSVISSSTNAFGVNAGDISLRGAAEGEVLNTGNISISNAFGIDAGDVSFHLRGTAKEKVRGCQTSGNKCNLFNCCEGLTCTMQGFFKFRCSKQTKSIIAPPTEPPSNITPSSQPVSSEPVQYQKHPLHLH